MAKNEAKKPEPEDTGTAAAAADTQQPQTSGQEVAVYDPGSDAGAGMEGVSRDEYSVPFVYVLDAKSPQCAPVSAGGIAGAKAGMLLNTGTNEIYDGEKGVYFIPAHRDHNYGEWIPRNPDGSGGGFVGIRAADDPMVVSLKEKHGKFGRIPTADGHELVEAYYIYGHLVPGYADGDFSATPALIPFKSTGIVAYKNFITRVMGITYPGAEGRVINPPLWAHLWKIGTVYRPAKKAGQSGWYIPKLWLNEEPPLKARLKTNDPLYIRSRELYESIKSGRVKAAKEQQSREPGDDEAF